MAKKSSRLKEFLGSVSWHQWVVVIVSILTLGVTATTLAINSLYVRDDLKIAFSPAPHFHYVPAVGLRAQPWSSQMVTKQLYRRVTKGQTDLTIINNGNRSAAILGLRVVISVSETIEATGGKKVLEIRTLEYALSPAVVPANSIAVHRLAQPILTLSEPEPEPTIEFGSDKAYLFETTFYIRYAVPSGSAEISHSIVNTEKPGSLIFVFNGPKTSPLPVTPLIQLVNSSGWIFGR